VGDVVGLLHLAVADLRRQRLAAGVDLAHALTPTMQGSASRCG
jgi:hypothetical protein